MRATTTLALVLSAAVLSGCGGAQTEGPHTVLRAYGRALEEGRPDDAYRLLSDDARRGISLAAFRKRVQDAPDEARELGQSLGRPTTTPVVTATVTTAAGQELRLVLENGTWKVDLAAVDLYAQDTPRHAVQSFLRALGRKRYDVALRFVPDARREGLDEAKLRTSWEGPEKEEIERTRLALEQALPTAQIEETGDRATLPYGGRSLLLVRENGAWKIEDFD